MSLTVALVLSGLEVDQWGSDLKEIYRPGAILFQSGLRGSPSSSSVASSSGASSYYSIESGISSMSPESTLDDHLDCPITAFEKVMDLKLTNQEEEKKKILKLELVKPEVLKVESKKVEVVKSEKKKVEGVNPEVKKVVIIKPEGKTVEILKSELKIEIFNPLARKFEISKVLIYQGRNLLDLEANLRGEWKFQTARLPDGVGSYFENRSQYSRLQGAAAPQHKNVTCTDTDCSFIEPIYY